MGVLCLSISASAGERAWYVAIEGGAEFGGGFNNNGSYSATGPAVLATVGRHLGPNFSLEGEFGYRSVTEDPFISFDVTQISTMVNAVYEIPVSDEISLSLGAGVGLDYVQVQFDNSIWLVAIEDSDVQLAAQLKLGVNYQIGETTNLSVNYRLMTVYENTFTDIDNETLTVGLKFEL